MLTTFTRQFSTLQDAGLPVLRSLQILEKQMKPAVLKNSLIDVVDDVESGSTLSEAFGKHPKCFDRLYVNMVRAGEAGGALEVILQRLADFMEKAQSLKRKIIGAMVYPAVVILVAVGILTFIMVAIIPKFKKIFDEFGMTLPWATQTLIKIVDVDRRLLVDDPAVPARRSSPDQAGPAEQGRELRPGPVQALDTASSGNILEKIDRGPNDANPGHAHQPPACPSWRRCRIVRETSNNAVFERMFQRVIESIREGDTIADPLKQSRLVDDMVVNMVEVGEETGDLDTMLFKVADFYDEEVDTAVKALISLLEPIMIVFLGFTIGVIVISLFLPLIKLLEGLSK